MSETLMSDAATTTEGQAAAQPAADATPAQAAAPTGEQQQATEQQPTADAGQTAETDSEAGEESKPQGAPEKYDFTAPEGSTFDDAVIEQFSEVARELDLPQDAAQKILDKVTPVIQARQAEQLEKARQEWADTSRADKEFGGDKLNENLAVAKKAMDKFGSPELRTLLNESGLGNHPEVIRMFYRAGKAISEDNFVTGRSSPGGLRDAAAVLYPSQH